MGAEKRRSERSNLKILVQVEHESQLQKFYSQNISGGGIFLEVSEFLPIGREVNLSFKIPGTIPGRKSAIKVVAKVVRHHTMQTMDAEMEIKEIKGVGLAFVKVKEADRLTIEQFVSGKGLALQG